MSISKRLFNFARSELNSLLDRAKDLEDGDSDAPSEPAAPDGAAAPSSESQAPRGWGRRKVRLEDLSDEELEAEIERRRLDREIDERAARASTAQARAESGSSRTRAKSDSSSNWSTTTPPPDAVARAYAALEVPPGSDFETVRKAYRTMMRKYHPDRHTASPDKQKAANELAQKLTDAYKTLEKRLRKPTQP